MKILAIVSGLDFRNHTRRSTLAAIHKLNPEMDVLLFNSIRNYFAPKISEPAIKFYYYNFWVVEKLRKYRFLTVLEHYLRGKKWRAFFEKYQYIFIIDPNQYYLLPYFNNQHKLIYLLRDPVILQNPLNYKSELLLIKRANAILAISESLKTHYINKHYGFQPEKIFLWSNSVDLGLWDRGKYQNIRDSSGPVAGMAGNINKRTDLYLLKFLLIKFPEIRFEIAGNLNLNSLRMKLWEELLCFKNLCYLGYIQFANLPAVVSKWDIGLLLESKDDEYASYFNHNKIYQYMALGKPFVSFDYNEYFNEFKDAAFIGKNPVEYAEMINLAIGKSKSPDTVSACLLFAQKNSTEKRADQFLAILKSL